MKQIPVVMTVFFISLASWGAHAGLIYQAPAGGWTYEYTGNAAAGGSGGFTALDGTWSHDNISDHWDGSAIGTGAPGGAMALTDGATSYLRLQDTGDPRDHGVSEPSNRNIYFGHNITSEGAPGNVLDAGVTLSFRTRIATTPPLDDTQPDGGGATSAWPSGGDGYVTSNGGRGNFGIHQADGGIISFSMALNSEDTTSASLGGLVMNNLNGNMISGQVDQSGDDPGTLNIFNLSDPTQWHEFWITIQAGGTGTNLVNVYADGLLSPMTFNVTAGDGADYALSYLGMGLSSTGQSGAEDVDFFSYHQGVIMPTLVSTVPAPPAIALFGLGLFVLGFSQRCFKR